MISTILLLLLLLSFIGFLAYAFIKKIRLTNRKNILFMAVSLALILVLFLSTGLHKIKSDLSRVVQNSSPKKAAEVYDLLFKKPTGNCLAILNFKDQVIPKIDCCIWMEVNICPPELIRILNQKKYTKTGFNKTDLLKLLNTFNDRPSWWTPQILGDSITKASIRFDEDNEQTLFFGRDSSHVYLCDQAL